MNFPLTFKYGESLLPLLSKIIISLTPSRLDFRFDYLKKTIELLNDYGKVYLVRMPVHKSLLKIEDSFDPYFDKRMIILANNMDIEYLDFSIESDEYSYTDGNHLYIEDAKRFSVTLSERIKKFN